MSPPDTTPDSGPARPTTVGASADAPAAGSDRGDGGGRRGLLVAVAIGLSIGLLLIGLAHRERSFAGLDAPELEILVNGLDARTGRDVLLPLSGWVVHVVLPEGLPADVRETLVITLREERTGTTIDVADRFALHGDVAVWVVPESVGLVEGLFSIRASLRDGEGHELARHRRVRIRGWLGGPPIGDRQIVHFDFDVDRDGDGRPDFEQDLERLGLASSRSPGLAPRVARAVAERALARVLRAYDPSDDPNGTFRERDTVFVRFVLDAEPTPVTTRICVGGANEAFPGSVGNVRFDPGNAVNPGTTRPPPGSSPPSSRSTARARSTARSSADSTRHSAGHPSVTPPATRASTIPTRSPRGRARHAGRSTCWATCSARSWPTSRPTPSAWCPPASPGSASSAAAHGTAPAPITT